MKNLFGPLEDLYNNSDVSEINVDKFDDVYWVESGKIKEADSLFKNSDEIMSLIKNLFTSVKRDVETIENGFADIRLSDGTSIVVVLPPISTNGPSLLIRKIPPMSVSVEDVIKWEAINEDGWKICAKLMEEGKSILHAGNAGCGKTTVANLLIGAINPECRVVTVERVSEIVTDNRKRTLRLETPRGKQSEMADLIKKASLLHADAVVINELMGEEAFEAAKLMREGSSVLATISAEGASDALKKCELFCMMGQYGIGIEEIKYHISSGVDFVIYQERLPSGKRVISNISSLQGIDEMGRYILTPLFVYDESDNSFVTTKEGKKFLKN